MPSMVVVDTPQGARQVTPQGQRALVVVDAELAAFTEMMEFDLDLFPGQVGWPHEHEYVTPLVRINRSGGPIATLLGPELEELVWIRAGQRGVIESGVPHVCVYPRRRVGRLVVPRWLQRHATGSETRNAKTIDADTIRRADLWPVVRHRVAEHGWQVTYPPDAPAPAPAAAAA